MRVLRQVKPTAQQLQIITFALPGTTLITGAAGSGKTSTALLRLHFLVDYWRQRLIAGHIDPPIRIVVLTFNRTLRGYIAELADGQVQGDGIELEVTTFAGWAWEILDRPKLIDDGLRRRMIGESLGDSLPWESTFVCDEVDYVLGRFLPEERDKYLTTPRTGRGTSPRVDRPLRGRLLEEVITPYELFKERRGFLDWSDVAVELARQPATHPYHIAVVDESQDFSANQVRALLSHLAGNHTLTFVLDAAQRIYPHRFLWSEVGVKIVKRYALTQNYRNTREIAAFCRSIVHDLDFADDGSLPDFEACTRTGPRPVVVADLFGGQMDYVISEIRRNVQNGDSCAILHALGGGYFKHVRSRLGAAHIKYVEISRQAEWPTGDENVALSTMASAKGLEFDHVYIVGLNAEVTPHGTEEGDDRLEAYRRLLAMAAGRARSSVMVGYKPAEASRLIEYIDPSTFDLVR